MQSGLIKHFSVKNKYMGEYKKCRKCGKDFPFEESFRKSKKIRFLCIDCINKLIREDINESPEDGKTKDNIERYESNFKNDLQDINWENPKIIIIAIIIILVIFALLVSFKRDYSSNNYPIPRPLEAQY